MAIYMVQNTISGKSITSIIDTISDLISKQKQQECKLLTHWKDDSKDITYLLFEASNKDAINSILNTFQEMNQQVLEVSTHLTEFYKHQSEMVLLQHNDNISIKVIVAFYLNNIPNQDILEYKGNATDTFNDEFRIIKQMIKKHKGKFIEHQEKSFVCFFQTVKNAIKCSLETRKLFLSLLKNNNIYSQIKIGISVGHINSFSNEFYNETINNVKYLCCFSNLNQLVVSSRIAVLFRNEGYILNENINGIKILSSLEENFIHQMMDILNKKLSIYNFSINELALDLGVSKSKLYRNIVSLTGLSPQGFIAEYKLIKALNLIEQGNMSLSEIAYETGFGSPSYFSKCFKKRYSIMPSEFNSSFGKRKL